MTEFWESNFKQKQAMWGLKPADSAVETAHFFSKHNLKKILIPGFGYGRNAKVFLDLGFDVTGIEISKTAIELAKKYFGQSMRIYHGTVSAMPFDSEMYDGIFSYALIHLLNKTERARFIKDCYDQLRPGGYLVFIAISKNTAAYGQGQEVSKNTFLTPHGVEIFYYDANSVEEEFNDYGLVEYKEIIESSAHNTSTSVQKFWYITCAKP